METKQPTMIDYMTLEDGEYQAESDDGGVQVGRESALGIATVRLRADYAAAPALLAMLIELRDAARAEIMARPGRKGFYTNRFADANIKVDEIIGKASEIED